MRWSESSFGSSVVQRSPEKNAEAPRRSIFDVSPGRLMICCQDGGLGVPWLLNGEHSVDFLPHPGSGCLPLPLRQEGLCGVKESEIVSAEATGTWITGLDAVAKSRAIRWMCASLRELRWVCFPRPIGLVHGWAAC
eukprot:Skav224336  [mRNA]  locus=scaffold1353:268039:270481:- [translate_table: standard]